MVGAQRTSRRKEAPWSPHSVTPANSSGPIKITIIEWCTWLCHLEIYTQTKNNWCQNTHLLLHINMLEFLWILKISCFFLLKKQSMKSYVFSLCVFEQIIAFVCLTETIELWEKKKWKWDCKLSVQTIYFANYHTLFSIFLCWRYNLFLKNALNN